MFCNNCGNKLEEGAVFCEKCGARVGAAPTAGEMNGAAMLPDGFSLRFEKISASGLRGIWKLLTKVAFWAYLVIGEAIAIFLIAKSDDLKWVMKGSAITLLILLFLLGSPIFAWLKALACHTKATYLGEIAEIKQSVTNNQSGN